MIYSWNNTFHMSASAYRLCRLSKRDIRILQVGGKRPAGCTAICLGEALLFLQWCAFLTLRINRSTSNSEISPFCYTSRKAAIARHLVERISYCCGWTCLSLKALVVKNFKHYHIATAKSGKPSGWPKKKQYFLGKIYLEKRIKKTVFF